MENLFLTAENIICHLRENSSTIEGFHTIKLLEIVQKHDCNSETQYKILEELLENLPSANIHTPKTLDGVSSIILITYLQEQQKLPYFNQSQIDFLWQFLLDQYNGNKNILCRTITAIGHMFATNAELCNKYFILAVQIVLDNISSTTTGILLISALQCLYKILITLQSDKLSVEQCTACSTAGDRVLQLHYSDTEPTIESCNISIAILNTFKILHRIIELNTNFACLRTAELLGLSKVYFNFGVDVREVSLLKPQKAFVLHSDLYESADEIEAVINSEQNQNCGGKTLKTRKLRAVVKNTRSENKNGNLIFDIKTSDSEVSEPENESNRILFERSRNAKIRLASIGLVGSVARTLDRKTLFGYWHVLFPIGTGDSIDNLLYLGEHDPNLRCRCAALQVCAHLLYETKSYLRQAEINNKPCPTAFTPFSVSLGYTILAIYKSLNTILTSESSLPVLTQALKCLAVLVQASPFKQFEKGFVQDFVKNVKPLVYHRDATIQVSALMVMEFLLAVPETTSDIAEAIGLPHEIAKKRRPKLHIGDEEIDIINMEELVESEEDSCLDPQIDEATKNEFSNTEAVEKTSWLLRQVLCNLDQRNKVLPTSVRIESLQVLIVMSSYFEILKPHLSKIEGVLLCSLKDVLPDIRLYAARCVDACAYQINNYLLNNATCSEMEIRECNSFWRQMMPLILNKIRRDSEEIATIRIILCDALSNIGALMFEHTSHSNQISLLSFLSGISSDSSEEALVRATSARALAVYALYPSLRGDLVFIENTAELTLRLVKDSNFLVRVKSFWSLGNISDALVGKVAELGQLRQERISDDLLFRLITAAISACSDSNKVRCHAVRTLGNLLRLLNHDHFNNDNWRQTFLKSICKLSDCISSSGNAKVKWNACYAISNLMRNSVLFKVSDPSWQKTIFTVLCDVIVNHSNFKVRINASAAIVNITERTHFGIYYEKFWSSVLEAIEKTYNLDNFYEYNHRDSLQEQLCLALSHLLSLAINDDFPMLKKHLFPRAEIIRSTWKRVINRMVPEKAAPLLSCPVVLLERGKQYAALSSEQNNILHFLIEVFKTE